MILYIQKIINQIRLNYIIIKKYLVFYFYGNHKQLKMITLVSYTIANICWHNAW